MTLLSVNVNKIATLRNSRGGNFPNLIKVVEDIQKFNVKGITVHPRPDERHITYDDVFELNKIVQGEFNIEGNPIPKFIDLVLDVKPHQVTLVPDAEDAITSNQGWNTIRNKSFLEEVISEFKKKNIRVSIFIENIPSFIEGAKKIGADRVELYTEEYAVEYKKGNYQIINSYKNSALLANKIGLGVNAGHDLNLENISFFKKQIPNLLEVSIGHALIIESLYIGFEKVIEQYHKKLV